MITGYPSITYQFLFAFRFSKPLDSHTCWTPWPVLQDGMGVIRQSALWVGAGYFHQQRHSTGASHPRPLVLEQEFRYLVRSPLTWIEMACLRSTQWVLNSFRRQLPSRISLLLLPSRSQRTQSLVLPRGEKPARAGVFSGSCSGAHCLGYIL